MPLFGRELDRRAVRGTQLSLPATDGPSARWEQYSLIAFDDRDIGAPHEDLEADREIDVLSKTGLEETRLPHSMLTPIDQLFADLTDRQLAALQLALERGYYEQPGRYSTSELAEETTIARATFEEHLRKAENKLVENAGHFVRLLGESRADTGLRKDADLSYASHT